MNWVTISTLVSFFSGAFILVVVLINVMLWSPARWHAGPGWRDWKNRRRISSIYRKARRKAKRNRISQNGSEWIIEYLDAEYGWTTFEGWVIAGAGFFHDRHRHEGVQYPLNLEHAVTLFQFKDNISNLGHWRIKNLLTDECIPAEALGI